MDLVEFLNARYSEEAAPVAMPAWHEPWCLAPTGGTCFYCGEQEDPTNVDYLPQSPKTLADIDAKRRIVELHGPADFEYSDEAVCSTCDRGGPLPYPCPTLRLLALPYAGHADFDEAWRP
ncbi:DUF6221 family protein [Streptomyces showdoensis]|uniref:Uncharacterized protein n=1 Tax=Streptomyces showdoensis TaxID=68268 RepID=A0A2P2GTJ4_STREW|nr:DUF6221 family protein [Streptomyces showdoensis]KKZ74818.1 hypothetical protein VO63_05015 [Streptomyces showdoensis]